MKFDETRIQLKLTNYLLGKGHAIVLPNISYSWMYWEADLISITRANYMHEYEIKISRQDFMKDFDKPKHGTLSRPGIAGIRIPNYFTYVAPIAAIPICIPYYAGLIEVSLSGRWGHEFNLIEIKKPKVIHRVKQDDTSEIAMLRTLMYKYWGMAGALDNMKLQRELFSK